MARRGGIGTTETKLDPGASLDALPGIGPTTAARLAGLGLRTLLDLALCFPRRYRALRELPAPDESAIGELVRLAGTVAATSLAWLPGRKAMVTVAFTAGDDTRFDAHFFNQPWLRKAYPVGQQRRIEGQLEQKGRRWQLKQARILPVAADPQGEVQLRYPDVEGVSSARLQQWIASCLQHLDWARVVLSPLPPGLAEHDAPLPELLAAMHHPADVAQHEAARRHFAVREAVELFTAVDQARRARALRPAKRFPVDPVLEERILRRIPFALSADQAAAVRSLWAQLAGPAAMGTLLQGDVGTGKTAVAIAAALAVLARGGQVAFLAPTELLAEQHCAVVAKWLQGSDVKVVLLTASQKSSLGAGATDVLARPGAQLVFGTHALLSSDATFPRLGLAIVDEQHRFGVQQRMALVHKGDNPHVLVMTATPIPRTLALTLFGDLDVVLLRQKPKGHRVVPAVQKPAEQWPRVVRSIARAVRRGGRVFVVCPAVGEDGEKGGAVLLQKSLSRQFRTALVHGRQPPAERQRALQCFRDGVYDVLVGTTVLEVGVDVPDATLVVIIAADRFGIATLHQLRGRVGRGARRGLAILCGPRTARVAAVCGTTDGFQLAEQDLAIRGSGELLGTAQSGFAELRALDPVEDLELLRQVREAVRQRGEP
jgi:ATP-dependent DNA helicase RecG